MNPCFEDRTFLANESPSWITIQRIRDLRNMADACRHRMQELSRDLHKNSSEIRFEETVLRSTLRTIEKMEYSLFLDRND